MDLADENNEFYDEQFEKDRGSFLTQQEVASQPVELFEAKRESQE